jgi:hypothetical protein
MQPQLLDNVRKITNPLNLAGLPFCHRVKRCLRIGTALHQSRLNRNFLRARLASGPGHGSTFLAPLLSRETIFPVVVHEGTLPEAMVLLSVELVARNPVSRSVWKDTCQSCSEILRRCVYVDKVWSFLP